MKSASLAATPWIKDGKAHAAVVVADQPFPIATYAAEELVNHVKLATGVRLAVVSESDAREIDPALARLYIGQTETSRSLDRAPLKGAEDCAIFSKGNDFFIFGKDGPGDPLDFTNVHSGTLWGVYEVLERLLEVRWLWPGELGISYRAVSRLDAPTWGELVLEPHFKARTVRTYVAWNDGNPSFPEMMMKVQQAGLAYSSTAAMSRYIKDQQVFLRRHRLGVSIRPPSWSDRRWFNPVPSAGHDFVKWWKKYGKDHPEWFQWIPKAVGPLAGRSLQARVSWAYGKPAEKWEGKRGPNDEAHPEFVSMCVSNVGLHKQIIRNWELEREKRPGEVIPISVGENDIWGLCLCDQCIAWDAPQLSAREVATFPEYVQRLYAPFDAGRRYALFYKAVYDLAKEIDPDVQVFGFAYLNYFVAPEDVQLHPNIVITFTPWGGWWFPRDPREQQWLRQQWESWRKTGATLFYRPNYTSDGGSMPHNYAHQMGDEFQFTYRQQSVGTDFDTLRGQWAAQGTTLYTLVRMHTRPEASTEEILEEYYTAFGPASLHVKAYFDFWEAHSTANRLLNGDAMRNHRGTNLLTYARAAHALFPPEAFDHAERILLDAKKVLASQAEGQGHDLFARRLDFIHKGLVHARKCALVSSLFADGKTSEADRRKAVEDLVRFRRANEALNIANFIESGTVELRSFQEQYDFGVDAGSRANPWDE